MVLNRTIQTPLSTSASLGLLGVAAGLIFALVLLPLALVLRADGGRILDLFAIAVLGAGAYGAGPFVLDLLLTVFRGPAIAVRPEGLHVRTATFLTRIVAWPDLVSLPGLVDREAGDALQVRARAATGEVVILWPRLGFLRLDYEALLDAVGDYRPDLALRALDTQIAAAHDLSYPFDLVKASRLTHEAPAEATVIYKATGRHGDPDGPLGSFRLSREGIELLDAPPALRWIGWPEIAAITVVDQVGEPCSESFRWIEALVLDLRSGRSVHLPYHALCEPEPILAILYRYRPDLDPIRGLVERRRRYAPSEDMMPSSHTQEIAEPPVILPVMPRPRFPMDRPIVAGLVLLWIGLAFAVTRPAGPGVMTIVFGLVAISLTVVAVRCILARYRGYHGPVWAVSRDGLSLVLPDGEEALRHPWSSLRAIQIRTWAGAGRRSSEWVELDFGESLPLILAPPGSQRSSDLVALVTRHRPDLAEIVS